MRKIKFSDLIMNSHTYRSEEYIKFFFSEIVGIKNQSPKTYKLEETDFTISILKDSTSRITDYEQGKLMEKAWRNCVFYFVDKNTYIKEFGSNAKFPTIKSVNNNSVEVDDEYITRTSQYPLDPKIQWNITKGFQDYVFNYFKNNHSSWFVRSYVYFILVICDASSTISTKDFHIHYWNTNYSFRQITSKRNIFYNVSDTYFVENVKDEISLIESANKDVIDCVEAYTNKLTFKYDTQENFHDIRNDIDKGIEYLLVQGAARTGKTILAMRLLGHYPDSVLLLMNYYFFSALKDAFGVLSLEFPKNRIFHHSLRQNHRISGGWIKNIKTMDIIPDISFLIVDEAQRLANIPGKQGYYTYLNGINEIDRIVNCPNHKHTIFFGDDYQKLNSDFDNGFSAIYDAIKDKKFREYSFRNSIGISPEILNNVKYILNHEDGGIPKASNKFEISITNSIQTFIEDYREDTTAKKHILCIGTKPLDNQSIEIDGQTIIPYPSELRDTDFPYFFNKEIQEKYMLSTYQVISRELESGYLYIPKNVTYDEKKQEIIYKNYYNHNENAFLKYHLYTLMTRATLKLRIFCEDQNLYTYIEEKIQRIDTINRLNMDEEKMAEEKMAEEKELSLEQAKIKTFTYDIFLAYHGTSSINGTYNIAKTICDYLRSNGYSVFLNNYSYASGDDDMGFDETWHAISRSKNFMFVFNDNVYRDSNGCIPRKNPDGSPNAVYVELSEFNKLVQLNERVNKRNLRFFYSGKTLDESTVYNFLSKYFRVGTYGNTDCCLFCNDDVTKWLESQK